MDQFSAHLDRGWDLVQRGDSAGAELSARRALEMDNQSPEAYNLLGYVAALQGEFEDAAEHYRTAISLDDTYFEAMLNAAEICIHPLGDITEALDLCDQALDLAESDDERIDALLLKFDALLSSADSEGAKRLCNTFPDGPYENPMHSFLVARALYEIGDAERAVPLIEAAVKTGPPNPEAWYYLGLIRDDRGDTTAATQAFLCSRQLDLEIPPPPWTLTRETFEETVRQAVAALPADVGQFLRKDEEYVSDVPGVEVVADGVDPRALLLLDGLVARPGEKPSARVIVYQRNVERLAGSVDSVAAEIVAALRRELTASFIDAPPPVSD
jgi:tetratricopeptide (TPR) repeat protein